MIKFFGASPPPPNFYLFIFGANLSKYQHLYKILNTFQANSFLLDIVQVWSAFNWKSKKLEHLGKVFHPQQVFKITYNLIRFIDKPSHRYVSSEGVGVYFFPPGESWIDPSTLTSFFISTQSRCISFHKQSCSQEHLLQICNIYQIQVILKWTETLRIKKICWGWETGSVWITEKCVKKREFSGLGFLNVTFLIGCMNMKKLTLCI